MGMLQKCKPQTLLSDVGMEACDDNDESDLKLSVWLRQSKFRVHFPDSAQVVRLCLLSRAECTDYADVVEPVLGALSKVYNEIFVEIARLPPFYRRVYQSGDPTGSVPSRKDLEEKQVSMTNDRYRATFTGFVRFLLRLWLKAENTPMLASCGDGSIDSSLWWPSVQFPNSFHQHARGMLASVDDYHKFKTHFLLGISRFFTTPYKQEQANAVYCYTAVMSFHYKEVCFKAPPQATSAIAGFLHTARAMMVGYFMARALEQSSDPKSRVDYDTAYRSIHHAKVQYFARDDCFPIGELGTVVASGMYQLEDHPPVVDVNPACTGLTVANSVYLFKDLRNMIASLLKEAGDLVHRLCLESVPECLSSQDNWAFLDQIGDQPAAMQPGYWFGDDPINRKLFGGLDGYIVNLIGRDKDLLSKYTLRVAGGALIWKPVMARRYLADCHHLLKVFFFLMQLTCGSPPRGTEMMELYVHNSSYRPRNIYIRNGLVLLYSRYNKTDSHTSRAKAIARLLPRELSAYVVQYMVVVRPCQLMLSQADREEDQMGAQSTFWLPYAHGSRWDTEFLSTIMQGYFSCYLGADMNISTWRQAFAKIKARCIIFPEDRDAMNAIWERQAGHSVRTGAQHYGIGGDNLSGMSDGDLWGYYTISSMWHQFLDVGNYVAPETGAIISMADIAHAAKIRSQPESAAPRLQTAAVPYTQDRRPARPPEVSAPRDMLGVEAEESQLEDLEDSVMHVLRDLHGPKASFLSRGQMNAIVRVVNGHSPLLIVLPTGGGKTDCFLVPALLPDSKITVVLAPLKSLVREQAHRCRMADPLFRCLNLDDDSDRNMLYGNSHFLQRGIICASMDQALTEKFTRYFAQARGMRLIDTVVFDEAHVPLLAHNFRQNLKALWSLLGRTQVLLLSATVPPSTFDSFKDYYNLKTLSVLRESTNRPNIAYSVNVVRDRLAAIVEYIVDMRSKALVHTGRVLIFCRTKMDAVELARRLDCDYYVADMDKAEQIRVIESFSKQSTGLPCLTATSCLSAGLDFADVRVVLHSGVPYTMSEFAQETGRSGRDERPAKSVVFAKGDPDTGVVGTSDLQAGSLEQQAVVQFLTTKGCRRLVLSTFLDGPGLAVRCVALRSQAMCDQCVLHTQRYRSSVKRNLVQANGCTTPTTALIGAKRLHLDTDMYAPTENQITAGEHSRQMNRLVSLLVRLKDSCVFCFVKCLRDRSGSVEDIDHTSFHCTSVQDGVGMKDFQHWRKNISKGRSPDSACCFLCGLPKDTCMSTKNAVGTCEHNPTCLLLAFVTFCDPTVSSALVDVASWKEKPARDLKEFGEWCRTGCTLYGSYTVTNWVQWVSKILLLQGINGSS